MNQTKIINVDDLVAMDDFINEYPIHIDLAYAQPDNLLLGQAVYRSEAQLWLHKDLANVVLAAARACEEQHGYHFILYDGLRTVEAQALMLETERVKENPHWLEEPRMVSPPGAGGHPRGMAVDLSLCTPDVQVLDMGTAFDDMSEKAHRNYNDLTSEQKNNRRILETFMMNAAHECNVELWPLPQEWWDFRLPPKLYERYAPLSDKELPERIVMAP